MKISKVSLRFVNQVLTLSPYIAVVTFLVSCHASENRTSATQLLGNQRIVQSLVRDLNDPTSNVLSQAQNNAASIKAAFQAIPGLEGLAQRLMFEVNPNLSSSSSASTQLGVRKMLGLAGQAPDLRPECINPPANNNNACPNVCVFAAAFASATACAFAEARACAICSTGETVCAWAKSRACFTAFAYGFAFACSGGGNANGGNAAGNGNVCPAPDAGPIAPL